MATTKHVSAGILSGAQATKRAEILELLQTAYWMEMETVMNYLAISESLDGVRAKEIAAALGADVADELGHARTFAQRIKELYGTPPGSMEFTAEHYTRIIEASDGVDWATQDMVIAILRDEEGHMRQFERFLAEYTKR